MKKIVKEELLDYTKQEFGQEYTTVVGNAIDQSLSDKVTSGNANSLQQICLTKISEDLNKGK